MIDLTKKQGGRARGGKRSMGRLIVTEGEGEGLDNQGKGVVTGSRGIESGESNIELGERSTCLGRRGKTEGDGI